jgi:hypothetical protein
MRVSYFIVLLTALVIASSSAQNLRPYDLITDQIVEECLAVSHQQRTCVCPSGVDATGPSLYAEPHRILDVDEAVELLTAVLPDLEAVELHKRLTSSGRFVWLKGKISAELAAEVHRLGMPGVFMARCATQ